MFVVLCREACFSRPGSKDFVAATLNVNDFFLYLSKPQDFFSNRSEKTLMWSVSVD